MNEILISFFGSGIWAIIKAVLLLLLAFITAAVVKSLVVKLLTKTKLNALLSQADSTGGKERSVDFIGKLTHLLVFLLFVPGIFESLGMREVSSPILNLLNTLWEYLPNILAAVIVLWVGFFIARLVRELLVPVFSRLKIDALQEKAGIQASDTGRLSNTLAYVVYVCDGLAGKALLKGNHTVLAMISKIAIYTVGIFMALSELGIAKEIVNTAFILIIAALAAAFAISFGVGGRAFAAKVLKKFSNTCGLDQEEKK